MDDNYEVEADSLQKIEQAIGFIKDKGMATSAELHKVMGLTPDELPSGYLVDAVKDGRLRREGKLWTIGDAPTFEVPKFTDTKPVNLPPKPSGGAGKPRRRASDPPDTTLRAAIWSDGMVELRRGDQTIAMLTQDEARFIAEFMERLT